MTEYPYVEAANYGAHRDPATIRFLVVHTPETPETATAAEGVAAYFASGHTIGSTHLVGDNDSIIRCVKDEYVANGAAGGNRYGWHYELAGRARQTVSEWADAYSQAALELAAGAFADTAARYSIPVRKIGPSQLVRGEKGICGHHDITLAFGKSTHTDPGDNFPWARFIDLVQGEDEMNRQKRLVRAPGTSQVFLVDGLHRRHVSAAGLMHILAAGLVADSTVYEMPISEIKAMKLVGRKYKSTY